MFSSYRIFVMQTMLILAHYRPVDVASTHSSLMIFFFFLHFIFIMYNMYNIYAHEYIGMYCVYIRMHMCRYIILDRCRSPRLQYYISNNNCSLFTTRRSTEKALETDQNFYKTRIETAVLDPWISFCFVSIKNKKKYLNILFLYCILSRTVAIDDTKLQFLDPAIFMYDLGTEHKERKRESE